MFVYLLHFDSPLAHAQHYIGFTTDIHGRLARHAAGTGASLTTAFYENGIGFVLARLWRATAEHEQKIKSYKCGPLICPVCRMRPRNVSFLNDEFPLTMAKAQGLVIRYPVITEVDK